MNYTKIFCVDIHREQNNACNNSIHKQRQCSNGAMHQFERTHPVTDLHKCMIQLELNGSLQDIHTKSFKSSCAYVVLLQSVNQPQLAEWGLEISLLPPASTLLFLFTTRNSNPFQSMAASMKIVDPLSASPLTNILEILIMIFFCTHLFMGLAPYICDKLKDMISYCQVRFIITWLK